MIAKGDVLNACNTRTYQGTYDVIQEFNGGLIAGGNGTDTDGIGLYVKAEGKIISDASDFVSNGTNYLEADQGFKFSARQHTYVSDRWTTKTWYGKKTTHTSTSTIVKGTEVHSATGVNILRTEHGGVNSIATRFSSPGGTEIYARDDVLLYSLKSKDHDYDASSSLWGLSKHSTDKTYQSSTPTLFVDNGVTRITSTEGSVDARGAYFIGAGDLSIKAQKRIKFGVDTLDHEIIDKSRSLGVSVPGMSALGAWRDGGHLMDVVTAEDATMAKLNGLLHSGNTTELMANSANLGINLYNTTNSVMRGLAGDTLGDELLSRYGLGGATGFSPAITLSMSESKTTTNYQTLAQGGVDRGGNVSFEAGEGIDLENGVRVHADGNMDVNAPEVIAKAAGLHSSMEQKTMTQSISLTPTGQLQDASVGYSKTREEATNYVNAELSAGGNMKLHDQDAAMKLVVLEGGIIVAKTMDADIDKLIIIDKQDVMTNQVESASASVSGQISVYKGEGGATVTAQQSGIHVVDGINTDGHRLHVGEASMTGGKITTDGENHIQIDKLVAVTLQDEQHYSGIGVSLNLHDLNRLVGQKATNDAGEQAIAIAALSVDRVRYQAEQTSVIYGAAGTAADIKDLLGDIHTSSADGRRVIKDDELHLLLDVPITNSDYMVKSHDNIQAGSDSILNALGCRKKPDETHDVDSEKKALPSKRKEEEEDVNEGKDADVSTDKTDKKGKEEQPIQPDVLKEIFDQALGDLKFDSPEDKESFKENADAALKLYKETGSVPEPILKALNEKIKSALIQTLKAGSEESWGRLAAGLGHDYNQTLTELLSSPDGLSKLGVKSYMGSKGLLITFCFNLGLASVDSKVDRAGIIKEGATNTASDITFGALLKFSTGSMSGPLGWGFMGLGILDDFTYDDKALDRLIDDGYGNLNAAQQAGRDGSYFAALVLRQVAADQIGSAGRAEALHELLDLPKKIAHGFGYVWDRVIKPTPSVDRNSFFSPEGKKTNSKPSSSELTPAIAPSS